MMIKDLVVGNYYKFRKDNLGVISTITNVDRAMALRARLNDYVVLCKCTKVSLEFKYADFEIINSSGLGAGYTLVIDEVFSGGFYRTYICTGGWQNSAYYNIGDLSFKHFQQVPNADIIKANYSPYSILTCSITI